MLHGRRYQSIIAASIYTSTHTINPITFIIILNIPNKSTRTQTHTHKKQQYTKMFPRKGSKDYSKISLDDFSDDDSDEEYGGGGHRRNNNNKSNRVGYHGNNGTSSNNDDFVQQSVMNQQQLMKKQDEGLDFLSQSAERLGQMSLEISDELNQQNKMLDDMENDLDNTAEELDLVTRKTKEFIKISGGEKNCMVIMILSIIILVLLFFLIYG